MFLVDVANCSEGDMSDNKTKDIRGKLFLNTDTSQLMGLEPVIKNVFLAGSCPRGSQSIWAGVIKQEMELEVYALLSELGPLLHPHEKDKYLKFKIPSLQSVAVQNLTELLSKKKAIEKLNDLGSKNYFKLHEVTDWPGKSKGIDFDSIYSILYHGQGLRFKYWINHKTGAISKNGKAVTDNSTVWDTIQWYTVAYSNDERKFDLQRVAAFSYWALRLGLKPPTQLVESLKKAGLDFKV